MEEVLTQEAVAFVHDLERRFGARRRELLDARAERQARLDAGELPGLPAGDARASARATGRSRRPPADLHDRRVEITGPADRKMVINALNSRRARVHGRLRGRQLADLGEHASRARSNLHRRGRRHDLASTTPDGKSYRLNDEVATLLVRPRGWHLARSTSLVDGEPVSAACSTSGSTSSTTPRELLDRGSGPYFYLPKLESHLEARLWNDVFIHAQDALGLPARARSGRRC